MHKELNGSQFVEIAGAGHISNIERPEVFHACSGRILNDIAGKTTR
jgi:pimeloyl-ACP methyl ester carboxylesterase